MKIPAVIRTIVLSALPCLLAFSPAQACTGLALKAADGSFVSGRTAEFDVLLDIDLALIPAETAFTGTTPNGPGVTYAAKYTVVGASTYRANAVMDGLNTAGLGGGAFYFPTFASYTPTTLENQTKSLAPSEFVTWALTQFATVAELRAAIESGQVVIAPTIEASWGPVPAPFHYIFFDKTGASLVVEPLNQTLVLHDNPIGVFTNSPSFDWHMTNLRNYIALSPFDVPAVKVDKTTIQPVGQGNGALGLPGDFTPPSRFVRAAFFSATAQTPKDGPDAALEVLHLLNNFDIPLGCSAYKQGAQVNYDFTQLTGVRDSTNLRYYWKGYANQNIQVIDLKKLPAAQLTPGIKFFQTQKTQVLTDQTDSFAVAK